MANNTESRVRTQVETGNANVRGLMVKQTGTGIHGTSAYLPAVTSVFLGLVPKKPFGKTPKS